MNSSARVRLYATAVEYMLSATRLKRSSSRGRYYWRTVPTSGIYIDPTLADESEQIQDGGWVIFGGLLLRPQRVTPMSYHAMTVTLENISGIVAEKDRYGKNTVRVAFNVTVAGKRHYAVQISGSPRLEDGMVVTAVLRDVENWQTLAGWLNHATGEICGVDSPGHHVPWCVFNVVLGVLLSIRQMSADIGTGSMIFWIFSVTLLNAWSLLSLRKSLAVYRLLKR